MTMGSGGVRVGTNKGGFIPLLLLSLAQLKQQLINARINIFLLNRIAGANLGVKTIKRLKVLG